MKRDSRGFSLLEILIAAAVVSVAAMTAVAFITRSAGHATWAKDQVFAREKALSIVAELRSFVARGDGQVAADLDDFDDGPGTNPTLTITPDSKDPGALVKPDHPVSANIWESGRWRWYRQISVRPFGGEDSRDLRVCAVRMYRLRAAELAPGTLMAEVSTIIRTIGEAFPSTQVYDLYLLALENVPAWWVDMGAMQTFVEGTLRDLETRNPGLKFRTHWITALGYGRDDEYAPFTNDAQESIDDTPWTYVYPGTMPAGSATSFYYVPARLGSRINVDGLAAPSFKGTLEYQEPFLDSNGNGLRDPGETYVDENGNDDWDLGNEAPYALADMHNHCKRAPEAEARFQARVDSGVVSEDTPTWRLLLDRMVAYPEQYHNAILVNLHGELLPMPPTRNFSDAAADPELRPGWRVVAHPERINTRRVTGDDTASDAPRYRVYAYKTSFPSGHEALMTQEEPFLDADKDTVYDPGEAYQDWNGNGTWDAGIPLTLVVRGGNFSANPNGAVNPSLLIERLPGGIDADVDGNPDAYETLQRAPRYPESFTDANGDGIRQQAEPYLDLNGDGAHGPQDPHQELDGDGQYGAASEDLDDANANGAMDFARPAETFVDANGNGRWDAEEPYWDRNKNGVRDGPTASPAPPWQAWDPTALGISLLEDEYVDKYGEPFLDLDGDKSWNEAETFFDANGNGVRDGGFARGEMWFAVAHIGTTNDTVVYLYGTPLETPAVAGSGLETHWRLYDLDYVPCPTPSAADGSGDPFARDLATSGDVPKNTARWRITLPLASVRRAFETSPGLSDGDAGDRVLRLDARIGNDLASGVLWPVWNKPRNLSSSYTWFCDSPDDLPFSERYQMRGDPRHSPYEDTTRQGTTAANGYNWFWDDFSDGSGNRQAQWTAFDPARLRDGWLGRTDHDIGRMMQWLRQAVVSCEAIYTTLTGFSYYYLSVGGDVGYDSSNGYSNSIPMDGLPFGLPGDVNENTVTNNIGTSSIRGSRKFVRSNAGTSAGIRSGGVWWSKPFLGELCPDEAYATQWKPWGNLRAALSSQSTGYRLMRRSAADASQLPRGTTLVNSIGRLKAEGSTSFFNIGSSGSTFHHQFEGGRTGDLVGAGLELATGYGYPIPATADITRPFSLTASGAGGVGAEFGFTDAYPRFSAALVQPFYDHERGTIGSGLLRLQEPGANPRGGYIVVNGLDKTVASGTSFIARYSIVSLLHGFFEAGVPGSPNRVMQLPQIEITGPTMVTELVSPANIQLTWEAKWRRWDGQVYTGAYAQEFSEDESDLVYVLLYSRDNGDTWLNILDESRAELGAIPRNEAGEPDPDRILTDRSVGAQESFVWQTPADRFPKGSYKIRIEAHRRSERNHYAMHMEKIYVDR